MNLVISNTKTNGIEQKIELKLQELIEFLYVSIGLERSISASNLDAEAMKF